MNEALGPVESPTLFLTSDCGIDVSEIVSVPEVKISVCRAPADGSVRKKEEDFSPQIVTFVPLQSHRQLQC